MERSATMIERVNPRVVWKLYNDADKLQIEFYLHEGRIGFTIMRLFLAMGLELLMKSPEEFGSRKQTIEALNTFLRAAAMRGEEMTTEEGQEPLQGSHILSDELIDWIIRKAEQSDGIIYTRDFFGSSAGNTTH